MMTACCIFSPRSMRYILLTCSVQPPSSVNGDLSFGAFPPTFSAPVHMVMGYNSDPMRNESEQHQHQENRKTQLE